MLTHGPSSGPRNSLISNSHSNTSHNTSISDAYNSLSYANAIFSPLHCQVSRFTPAKAARCPMTRIIEHAWCETVGSSCVVMVVCTYCCTMRHWTLSRGNDLCTMENPCQRVVVEGVLDPLLDFSYWIGLSIGNRSRRDTTWPCCV